MKKGAYVDGFVISIPKKNAAKYKKMAQEALRVWTKFGALDYKECVIEDPAPKFVSFTFAEMAKARPSEAVWFSFIAFKSRKHRDEVNKKVMAFLENKYGENGMEMPFDMKRFSYAGFKVVVGA